MLTTTPFFVKTCFPKSFIIIDLRALTEELRKVIFKVKGLISYFFDNEERKTNSRVSHPFLQKAKAST